MKTILSAFISLAILADAMAPASVETAQTFQPTDTIGDIGAIAQAPRAGEHVSRRDFQASNKSPSKALPDSPWGDDAQSLPLFSGFMNPPPAYAPSPNSNLACKESQIG